MTYRSIGKILLVAFLTFSLAGLCLCLGCTRTPPIEGPGNDDPLIDDPENTEDADLPAVEIPRANLIQPDELNALILSEHYVVIDARAFLYFVKGSIPGAINIPLRFVERRQAEIPRNRLVVFVATDALELSQLYGLLIKLGFDPANIRMLEGGIPAWEAAGYVAEDNELPPCPR